MSGHGAFSRMGGGGGGQVLKEGNYVYGGDTEESGEKYAMYLFENKDGHNLDEMKVWFKDWLDRYKEAIKKYEKNKNEHWDEYSMQYITNRDAEREFDISVGDEFYHIIDKNGVNYFFDSTSDVADMRKHLRLDSIRYIGYQNGDGSVDSIGFNSESRIGDRIAREDHDAYDGYSSGLEKIFGDKTYISDKTIANRQRIKAINEYSRSFRKTYGRSPNARELRMMFGE